MDLVNGEKMILDEIAMPEMKRKDIASTYGLIIRSGEKVDWPKINTAIMNRWSKSGLLWIKEAAWKKLEGK